jgi:hypothetical protein
VPSRYGLSDVVVFRVAWFFRCHVFSDTWMSLNKSRDVACTIISIISMRRGLKALLGIIAVCGRMHYTCYVVISGSAATIVV